MQHSFIKAALSGKNDFWRYLVSIFLIIITNLIASIPALLVFGYSDDAKAAAKMDFATAGIPNWLGLLVMLFPFAVGVGTIWLAVKYFHHRNPKTLIHSTGRIRWRRVGIGALIWLIFLVAIDLEFYRIHPAHYEWTFDPISFFPVLIIVLIFIPLQIAFEELLLRSYLMQGLGIAFRYPIIPLLMTSTAFGALHFLNPEVLEHGDWLIWSYVQMGVMLGLAALLDEGLEIALGVHLMNNLYASLIVTFPNSALPTPALFTMTELNIELMYIYSTIAEVLFLLIGIFLFKWKNWGKLFRKISMTKNNSNDLDM